MICPVCHNEGFSAWGAVGRFTIQQCCGCGLGVTTPFPGREEQETANRQLYSLEQRIAAYQARHGFFVARYRRQLRAIRSFKQTGRLLDIGCNIGIFLNEARRSGFDVAGVELNSDCAGYARSSLGLDVRSEYLEEAGFSGSSFDVVTMYDVLEHVPDLYGILAEVRRILKPDGLLVVQSPNIDSVMADATGSAWSWLSPPDHLYHFTPASLTTLIGYTGFTVAETATWEPADDFCNDLLRVRFGDSRPGRVIRKLIRVSGMFRALVSLAQPVWWRQQRGALVELYAFHGGEK